MTHTRLALAALAIGAGLSTPAVADDGQDCKQADADKAIAACSRIITKGAVSGTQLAVAYANRGGANRKKAEPDKAIADYTKAIEIDPKFVFAYNERGVVHRNKGEFDRSIADFTKAIEIDPRSGLAYLGRGISHRSKGEHDKAIVDHTKAIELAPSPSAIAYIERGIAYRAKGQFDLAIADHTKAVELAPKSAVAYNERGITHRAKGQFDLAIADHGKAIEIDPKYFYAFRSRGLTYFTTKDFERSIADYTKAIAIDPKLAVAYNERGNVHYSRKDHDRAVADYTKAIEIDQRATVYYNNRGNAYHSKGELDRALADFVKAIEIDPKYAIAYANRGKAHEAKGNRDAAIADYEKVVALPAASATDLQRQEIARQRIARLKQTALGSPASTAVRRVALVIGNSNYAHAGVLANPVNDARAIAATLGRLQFAVTEHYDLTREKMGRALKDFGDRAEGAEWAVVFFAGHGLEINGTAYLVPIDAELKRDTHVGDETLSLTQVQAKVDAATKLGLVILDACRNNPFVARMVRTGGASRSIGRGLSPIEPEGNVLVAYAAKHGTTADDGSGKHSPFTEALLGHLEEPGLEINFLFRKVRDRVRARTARQQEPFLYGSLGSEPLYFKAAVTR